MKENIIGAVAALALFIGVVLWFHQPALKMAPTNFGATSAGGLLAENYIPYILYNGGYSSAKDLNITGGVTFGSSGTTFTQFQKGTCSLIAPSFTVAASTTVSMDCAVTGVVSGDIVFADFATSTVGGNGWAVDGSSASTTSGFITLRVTNWTGASNVIQSSIASSTDYLIIR